MKKLFTFFKVVADLGESLFNMFVLGVVGLFIWDVMGSKTKEQTELHTDQADAKSFGALFTDAFVYLFTRALAIALIVGVLWAIAAGIIAFQDRGKAVVYSLRKGKPQNLQTFYLSEDRKHIIAKYNSQIRKLDDCTIIDMENWVCKDLFSPVSMSDGEYDDGFILEHYEQVSPVHYYFNKFFGIK